MVRSETEKRDPRSKDKEKANASWRYLQFVGIWVFICLTQGKHQPNPERNQIVPFLGPYKVGVEKARKLFFTSFLLVTAVCEALLG